MRRILLALAIACLDVVCVAGSAQSADMPTVKIAQGALAGTSEDGVAVFKGIPFAAPPVGDLRWRAPQPAASWTGTRDASAFGAICPQAARRDMPDVFKKSEDCLTLNVWSGDTSATPKRPVMVWIYGGAFVQGGSAYPFYDGTDLAKRGVVVVSINYRLGYLGFLAHPAFARENPNEPSGNYGLMDQIAALKWVQANIAQFGGDPANVTIFGESAGGISVNDLVASPAARGLFAKAISESGLGLLPTPTLTSAESSATDFATRMGASGDDKAVLAKLRGLSVDEILADQSANARTLTPMLDGKILPEDVSTAFAKGDIAKVPYLAGSNSNEATLMRAIGTSSDGMIKGLGDRATQVRAVYEQDGKLTDEAFAQQLFTDGLFAAGAQGLAGFVAKGGEPAHVYQFAYVADRMRQMGTTGVGHGGEVVFVFGFRGLANDPRLSRYAGAVTDKDRNISYAVQTYWTSFARTGDPNASGMPQWPQYTPASPALLRFDDTPQAIPDFRKPEIALTYKLWSARTGIAAPF
jgi:para-nitrobenzyl esterase